MPLPGAVGLGKGWGRELYPPRVGAGLGKLTQQVKCSRAEPSHQTRAGRWSRAASRCTGLSVGDTPSRTVPAPAGPTACGRDRAVCGLRARPAAVSSAELSRPGPESASSLLAGPGASPEAAAGLCRVPSHLRRRAVYREHTMFLCPFQLGLAGTGLGAPVACSLPL